jgi:glyoxylase-like metal-dependent hydrolase (beta-lactamase superfamily II)
MKETEMNAKLKVLVAALSLVGVSALHAADAPPPPPVAAVELAPGVYQATGGGGANSSFLVGPEGVLVVDAKLDMASAQQELDVIEGVSQSPIRFLINTHVHPDHTGGNEAYGQRGAVIIARDETRDILAAGQRGGPPAPAAALPTMTFDTGAITLHINGETVIIRDVPAAHTTDNSIVQYVNANVFHLGDVFQASRYPTAAGGTYQGFLDAADVVLGLANDQSKFIPGNGKVEDIAALRAMRAMLADVSGKVKALIAQGKTVEEVTAAKPTAAYDATYGDPARFLPGLYQELSAGR